MNDLWAYLIIEEFMRLGLTNFCIAPGARNSPLVKALSLKSSIKPTVFQDERAIGYFALGQSKADNNPSIVITTSGTAVANLLPAVIEAYYSRTSLILLTADRPPEAIETGANQTIKQANIFTDFAELLSLPPPTDDIDPTFLLPLLDNAVYKSRSRKAPIHINCPFREPLITKRILGEDTIRGELIKYPKLQSWKLQSWSRNGSAFTEYIQEGPGILKLESLLNKIKASKRGALVASGNMSDEEARAVINLSRILRWPLFSDITSGLRFRTLQSDIAKEDILETRICHYDEYLRTENLHTENLYTENSGDRAHLESDLVIHFGTAPVNRSLQNYLKDASYYVLINDSEDLLDPGGSVDMRIVAPTTSVCEEICNRSSGQSQLTKSELLEPLLIKDNASAERHKELINHPESLEWGTVITAIDAAPEGSLIFLGNSLTIRHADRYAPKCTSNKIIITQRGASGIDGNIAHALGYAHISKRPLSVIFGDMTFLYDISSLALARELATPVTVVIINNGGGQIFRRIPNLETIPNFDRLFTASHQSLRANEVLKPIESLYGFKCKTARSLRDLEAMVQQREESKGNWRRVVEVCIR